MPASHFFAERTRFELVIRLPVCRFSKPVDSATLPPLRMFWPNGCQTFRHCLDYKDTNFSWFTRILGKNSTKSTQKATAEWPPGSRRAVIGSLYRQGSAILKLEGQGYEIIHTQALGAEIEDWVGQEIRSYQRLEGIAEGFTALAEGGLHYRAEELFIAAESGAGITGQADHGGLHLWWRIERARTDSEKIFKVITRLKEDGQDTVGLGARLLGDALCDLLLNHAYDLRDAVAMLKDLEEYLRGNVVRKITDR